MLDREEIEAAERVAVDHDLLVITDEIYESITYDGRQHISPASVSEAMARRTVTILGLSKTFSITGWRLGYVAAPAPLAEKLKLVHDLFYICAPTPLQHGVAAGFDLPDSFFEEMRADYARKRDLVTGTLREVGLTPFVPEGAYYVLSDVSSMGAESARAAAMRLIDEAGVATVAGTAFFSGENREDGSGLVRVCYAKEMEVLEDARAIGCAAGRGPDGARASRPRELSGGVTRGGSGTSRSMDQVHPPLRKRSARVDVDPAGVGVVVRERCCPAGGGVRWTMTPRPLRRRRGG